MSEGQRLEDPANDSTQPDLFAPLLPAPQSGGRWARAILVRPGHGVRAVGPGDLQVVCDTGIYSLDAALQKRSGPGWFVLGQVFLWDDKPAEQLEVVLHVDDKPVEKSRTDAYGEFAFTSKPGRRLGVALHGSELALVELWRQD